MTANNWSLTLSLLGLNQGLLLDFGVVSMDCGQRGGMGGVKNFSHFGGIFEFPVSF